jgi:Cu/Zn superoxide dismutase
MRYWEIISEEGLVIPGVNTTPDVQPGEIKRQGAKLGFNLDANGLPPVWTGLHSSTKAKDTPNKAKKDQTFYGANGTPPNRKALGN